jgi:hypothetical protein
LPGQPSFRPQRFEHLQVVQNVGVMRPAIALKGRQPGARIFSTQSTVDDLLLLRTVPERAFGASGMNVQTVRAASLTRKALQRPALPGIFGQEVFALWKRRTIVVTSATVKAAYPQ